MLRSPLSLRNLLVIVLCASGVFALAGCGAGSSQLTGGSSTSHTVPAATATPAHTSSGPLSTICPLVTPAQLKQITGITFNSGIDIHPGGAPAPGETADVHCAYQQTVNQISNVGSSALWFSSSAAADAFYTGGKTSYGSSGANPTDVSGIGDKAFSFVGGLFVLKGNIVLFVTYVAPSQHTDVNAETQIANIILPQL